MCRVVDLKKLNAGDVYTVSLLNTKFSGVCIGKKRSGSIILRNVLDGEGVEYLVNINNPMLREIKLVSGYSFSKVRRKLYYLRTRRRSKTKVSW